MMKEQKRVPKLRFEEFSESWRSSNIEDLFEFKNGLNKEKEFFGRGTPIINFMDVYKLNSINSNDIDGLVELNESEIERFSAKKGDVFFTRTSETIDDIGMSATLVEPIKNCVFSGFVLRARPKQNTFLPLFTSYLFGISSIRKEITTKSSMTTRALTSGTLLNKVNFLYPENKQEQKKIASFLSAVDKKITQLQQKKSLLEQYKKGVMQQIFPSASSGQVPQLRFTPEDGSAYPDWEEKRLGEIGKTINGLTGKTKENFGTGKPYIQYKQIFDGSKINIEDCGLVDIKENERQTKVRFGDVFFTTSSETANEIGTASVLLDEVEEMYLNSFCFGLRIKQNVLNPSFAQFLFRSSEFRRKMIPLAQGSTRYNISKSSFLKLNVELPCIEEQTQIAHFLSSIDKKIAAVQTQIAQTQRFKKGLLQQLFV
ncbi:MAG: restriction endonuclease subunit S [Flavobacteriia bacterium]|nr:MAG: restriction endonuclease subunit S [Flavobacteriia bacterium]